MNIGIDTRLMNEPQTGMGVYIHQVVNILQKIDKTNNYIFYSFKSERSGKTMLGKLKILAKELFWIQLVMPFSLRFKKVDLFFSPNPPVPLLTSRPIVVTVPDLSFYFDKAMSTGVKRILFFFYRKAAQKARKIATFSLCSKKDIVDILSVPEDKIVVTHLGLSSFFKPVRDKCELGQAKKRYGINGKFILTVPGSFIPRKNIRTLLQAYHELPGELRLHYKLVIAGKKAGSDYQATLAKINDLNLNSNIVMTDSISQKELSFLYSAADLVVFPSLYEGFGLPPIEAMACGTPVIASNVSSLPEVVGDAGILVDPSNFEEIRDAMVKALTDSDLREELRQKGFRRAKMFSWENNARSLLNVFEELQAEIG